MEFETVMPIIPISIGLQNIQENCRKKGKTYADKVEKSVQNHSIATLAAYGALAIGSGIVNYYLTDKYY